MTNPGSYFDDAAADRVVNWFEKVLIAPEIGRTTPLPPWLKKVLRTAYGTKNADGTRQYRTLYLEVPKKNAKSFILSGLALYHLAADGERSPYCICCAGTANQAGIVFDTAKKMAKTGPLSKQIGTFRFTLTHPKSGGRFMAIPADAETAEGPKCSFVGFDELHVQRNRKLWDTLRGSGLSRRQPMTVVATTAGGSKTGIAWEQHDYACRVRDGKLIDSTFLPVVYGWEEGDDPHDPEVWKRCNPSYGITFTDADFRAIYEEAKNAGPARFASWQRYHLNRWSESITAWLPMDKWEVCGERTFKESDLIGRPCYPGLDLSSVTDLTAVALAFPEPDGSFLLIVKQFMPRGRVLEAELRDGQPYREWADQGYLELTDGDSIDQKLITRRVIEMDKQFPFVNRQVRMDIYNAIQVQQDLELEGFTTVPQSPGNGAMSPPSKELLRLVIDGKLHHNGNPLLRWEAAQADVKTNWDGNIRPVKGDGEFKKRIDGIIATVIALAGAMVNKPKPAAGPRKSIYDTRGVLTV